MIRTVAIFCFACVKAYVKLEYSRRRDAEKVQAALEEMTERDNELNILYGRE